MLLLAVPLCAEEGTEEGEVGNGTDVNGTGVPVVPQTLAPEEDSKSHSPLALAMGILILFAVVAALILKRRIRLQREATLARKAEDARHVFPEDSSSPSKGALGGVGSSGVEMLQGAPGSSPLCLYEYRAPLKVTPGQPEVNLREGQLLL